MRIITRHFPISVMAWSDRGWTMANDTKCVAGSGHSDHLTRLAPSVHGTQVEETSAPSTEARLRRVSTQCIPRTR